MDLQKIATELSFEKARIKEQQIREGLIYLGWLPPEQAQSKDDRIRELEGVINDCEVVIRNSLYRQGNKIASTHDKASALERIEALRKTEKE